MRTKTQETQEIASQPIQEKKERRRKEKTAIPRIRFSLMKFEITNETSEE